MATIKDITAAAGVTQGLLYHYFTSKDALVQALLEERGFLPQMSDVLTRSHGRPASEVLPELLAGFRALRLKNADLVALLSAVALGQITGADIEPDSLVDMVIRGVGAAVVNFSQRAAAGDAAQLEGIFDRFERWSRARSALQLLTLFSVAWALAAGIAGA